MIDDNFNRVRALMPKGSDVQAPHLLDLHVLLSQDEYAALIGLLDLGVKNGGLKVAAAAAVLNQKFEMASQVAIRAAASRLSPPQDRPPAPAPTGANGAAHASGAGQTAESPPSA